ncbi:WhiB family transcriptional regulator [Streptomyces boncukensis]|uniref:Transcriptional regulator WhiB n=1 Tax=Streptomyces boncukensis TaxID=2711219 RepID=A0A6G4WYL7_9ACTN|nr:WhiB family transcriptional regulator [Streptomyces boncukensis]NGO70208.1 WhiB family transcriptional regulator [Streptomyces boncukensis]
MDWRESAACADEDPDLFFPLGSSGPGLREREQAKRVCSRCPVKAECLEWALRLGGPGGIWGGLDENERAELRERSDGGARGAA